MEYIIIILFSKAPNQESKQQQFLCINGQIYSQVYITQKFTGEL